MPIPQLNNISPFSFLTAGQIRFGRGTAKAATEDVARFGRSVLLVRGRAVSQVDDISTHLEQLGCSVNSVFAKGEPTCADVDAATKLGRAANVEVILAIGGGAVLDLGKAVAAMIPAQGNVIDYLEGIGGARPLTVDPLPCVAMSTTAGTGSEVTKNAVVGVPSAGRKVSLRDDRMLPRLAVIDPSFTVGTPASVTFSSGFDAVTQVIEPYLSIKANPLTDALSREAIPLGLTALAQLAREEDEKARDQIAYVSLIGGIALANAGLGAVHGLAGVIGGRFSAPHGLICARLLGPVLRLNREAERAASGDDKRYSDIATWMSAAFDVPPLRAFEMLNSQLDDLALPRLGQWIEPGTDLRAISAEALTTSSIKSNALVLTVDQLTSAVEDAL